MFHSFNLQILWDTYCVSGSNDSAVDRTNVGPDPLDLLFFECRAVNPVPFALKIYPEQNQSLLPLPA